MRAALLYAALVNSYMLEVVLIAVILVLPPSRPRTALMAVAVLGALGIATRTLVLPLVA